MDGHNCSACLRCGNNKLYVDVCYRKIQRDWNYKCLGATDSNVLEIFLIEALLLGLLGGVIGAFAGWIAAIGIFGFQFGIQGVFPADNIMPVLAE